MSEQLETSKLQELRTGSWSIKGSLVNNGRCPKCTLKPPCKHYEKAEDLPSLQQVQPAKRQLGNAFKALPPIPPPTNLNQPLSPPVNNHSRKTEDAYQRLLNAENDPVTAGLVQSYLRRQQQTQNSPSIPQQPQLEGVHTSSTPLTSDGGALHSHAL